MNTQWAEISCKVPADLVDTVAEFLIDLSGNGVSIENLAVDTFSVENIEDSPIKTVKAYFPMDRDLEGKVARVSAYLASVGAADAGYAFPPPSVSYIRDEDWANNWKSHFKPSRIGKRVVIKPTWEPHPATPGDVVIELDPGMAFGTGTHPTTRLCLEAVEQIFFHEGPFHKGGHPAPQEVLDVGTGSGVLAVAAAKFGASRIVAIDIDPVAVDVAAQNIALNGVEKTVRVSTTPVREITGEYGIIVANILAEELVRLGSELVRRMIPGGFLILSGILIEKEEFVQRGFSGHGLTLIKITREDEWSCLTYCKEERECGVS